ncbi:MULTISPECIES: zinc-binding dehydrogenase [unclassified Streptomyces]|uniref:zinc-binding dehydrogenase n=1 Tax=unclassified Streptomyces TaxID=2593676 RepID=UPI001BEB2240|nr:MULTISPECIES: zinc-binding dehydrogenase [unclassified Streptomyces]MBT2408596.1 zinc-binding dehydrogenase [Streptomyces sp. ISL-21]MBT2608720.1 zinc-binding dehydrogenase [Streptomyces sp. ISL-87]
MKALIPTGDPAEPVVFADVPEPTPRPNEALVKVEAFSVNRGETFKLEKPVPGERPGKDIAGLVVQPAADGSGPAGITRVVGHPMAGGWAEYVAVPTDALAVLPDAVCALAGAALPLAGLTALRLLRAAGPVLGRRVLLTGASGGVGHYVTELAAAAGGVVTAVTRNTERGTRLAELGAADIVHDVADARGPYDVVLESTGGPALPLALARLAKRGTLIWFGQASRTPATLDFFDFFTGPESAVIRHFHYLDADTSLDEDLAALVRLTAEGRLHPEIGRVAGWADTATTLTDLRDRRIRGKAVLTLS